MMKKMKKLAAMLLAVSMLIMLLPSGVFAAEDHADQVHVVVENATYTVEAGAPWEGRIVDAWVTIDDTSTGLSVLEEAVGGSENLDVVDGAYGTYINGIKGIIAGDGGSIGEYGYNPAGWLYAVNGTVPNFGIGQCSVADGTLEAGDEIAFLYSLDGGPDIGYDWSDTEKKALKSLTISAGVLSPVFASGVTSYTLTIPSDVESIVVTPVAENMTETVTISVNGVAYKQAMNLPVETGTQIEIKCSNGTEETSYSIYVKEENKLSAETMTKDVLNVLDAGLTDTTCVYGNEWAILALARGGKLSTAKAEQYYASVESAVRELGSGKLDERYATTNARVILALSAIGEDPSDVAGYNLFEPLADMNYIQGQGVNAAIYALLAFDANQYAIPTAKSGEVQVSREGLIQSILDAQLPDGGWDYVGVSADPDLTAMALQALAPYNGSNADVKEAVRKGVQVLSEIQNPDGSYSSWGYTTSYSAAQVLTALSILQIDPMTDSRFIKNGYTVIDTLGDFFVAGSGFKGNLDAATDAGATVQAAYALVAYNRYVTAQNSLYDMTDVKKDEEDTTVATTEATITEDASSDTTIATEDTTTETVTTTATTEGKKATDNTPKTGDATPVALLIGMAVLAMTGVVVMNRKKKA